MLIHRFLVLAAALSASAAAAQDQQTILIDFGSTSRTTAGLANNITEPGMTGPLLSNAQDTIGELTTVSVFQLDGWCGVNQKGCEGDEPYPESAIVDSFYLGEAGDRTARLRIEGLTPGEPYDFTFFASRMDGTRKREALYRIGDREARLDAASNRDACAAIAGSRAGSDGTTTIDIQCADEDGYAYLGVLEIRGRFAQGALTRRPADRLDGPPVVSAKAWAIAEGKTGRLLWGFNEDQPRKIASTTKIMCAWVVIQEAMADPAVLKETVTFSKLADDTGGSTSGLRAGERAPVGQLLYGLLLPSGNDAGNALAEHFNDRFAPPEDPALRDNAQLATRANFVAEMNRNARRLGMENTTYRLPYGDGGTASQFTSTPRDLLKLAYVAIQNPLFRKYVSTRRYRCQVSGPDESRRFVVWTNTNRLLPIEGYDGVKTGTNTGAGACLVSSGRREDDHLLIAVLGAASSDSRYVDTRNLFRWAWLQRGHRPDSNAAAEEDPSQ